MAIRAKAEKEEDEHWCEKPPGLGWAPANSRQMNTPRQRRSSSRPDPSHRISRDRQWRHGGHERADRAETPDGTSGDAREMLTGASCEIIRPST